MKNLSIFPLTIIVLLVAAAAFAGNDKSPSDPALAEITARGRMLYEYDQTAWHSTDAMKATNPPKESLGRHLAKKSDSGWIVGFGHFNEAHDKVVVTCEATQSANPQDFTVRKIDPPRGDTSFYLYAARAVDTALHDFLGEQRPYNVAVLPAPSNQLYVYVFPAQTRDGVYPLGGDARYLVSPDGNTIIEKRQLHKSILENRGDVPKGSTRAAGYHRRARRH